MQRLSLVAGCALLLTSSLLAQDARGRVTGRISDPSNASMAGVEVTVRNQATGTVVTARSSDSGAYESPYLPPAMYTFTVAAPGFRKYERIDLEVRIDDRLAVDIPLQLGEVSATPVHRLDAVAGGNTGPLVAHPPGEALLLMSRNPYTIPVCGPFAFSVRCWFSQRPSVRRCATQPLPRAGAPKPCARKFGRNSPITPMGAAPAPERS